MSKQELKDGQKIGIKKLIDPEVVLHPEISKWRDALTVDLGLMRSLKSDGQIGPTVFRILKNGKHELVAGARRYFHQKLLKTSWDDILKDIRKLTDRQALILAASENIFRKDFNPWEEARVINSLITVGNVKPKALAKKLGRSTAYIYSRMALLKLPQKIQKRFESKGLPIGYATHVAALADYPEAQDAMSNQIIEGQKSRYSGISTLEEAERFVAQVKRAVAEQDALLAKYGPCPACESKSISEKWGDEHLSCDDCNHAWHGVTKEPWEYYETKQKMKDLGFEVEEGLEKITLTPKDVAKIVQRKATQEQEAKEAEEEKLPDKFRTTVRLPDLVIPLINDDNIQEVTVSGNRIELKLIESSELHFTGIRKDYKDEINKSRIVSTTYYSGKGVEGLHEFINAQKSD